MFQHTKGNYTAQNKRNNMNHYITIGEIIRYYRKDIGLSQEELAKGICDRKYLSHIENNKNIPTLDIINQLSNRLGVNLYDSYAYMLRHNDIDTHKKIEHLQKYLCGETTEELLYLINEYNELPGFQTGEPLQHLKYAMALYYSNCLQQSDEAISTAIDALSTAQPFFIDNEHDDRHFSNVELSLLNLIAVEYCRIEQKEEAKKYFKLIQNYLVKSFNRSLYATNRNNQFEVKFLANHICNYFLFFRNEKDFPVEIIDKALTILKTLHSHHMLPELLLCKTYLLIQKKKAEEARELYELAHSLGNYLYTPDYQRDHNEKYLLGEYYTYFSTC